METSKADFELFKEEAMFWVHYFNLLNWDIDFHHESLEEGNLANVLGNYIQGHADIKLNDYWDDEYYSKDQIRKVAFHEVCELLLMETRQTAHLRFCTPEDIESSLHGVIQRLTNTVFKDKHLLMEED